jgi:ferric-dicitrate binding protein FerR (iron transport regulator)
MGRDCPSRSGAGLGAELLLISALLLVASKPVPAQTAAGSFLSTSGQVQIQRSGGPTIGAAAGVGVNVGDRIVTGAKSHAVVMLNDQSRLELGTASSVRLDQFTTTGGSTSTRVTLFSGVLRSVVSGASGGAPARFQVCTPNAIAALRGAKFDTAYTENVIRPGYQGCDRYTDVSVYEGSVNLAATTTPNASQDVGEGYEATLPCDKPPTPAGPLAMTGAVSLDSANAGGGARFAGGMPVSGGAAPPVSVDVTTTAPPPASPPITAVQGR